MIGALVRGLETDNPTHGRRIAELLGVFDDAVELLCDAFESPAVNVQVNAAIGLGMLGPKRVGKGRKALEGARTGGDARTREAVRKALDMLDGPRSQGPQAIAVEGFEVRVLGAEAFASAAGKLPPGELINYLTDGRAHVRANAATALGTLGPAVAGAAIAIGVLMRDDDMKVRIQAAWALDRLGDDAVREAAAYLIGALRGAQGPRAERAAQGAGDRRRCPRPPDPRGDQRAARRARDPVRRDREPGRERPGQRRDRHRHARREARRQRRAQGAGDPAYGRVRPDPRGGVQGARDVEGLAPARGTDAMRETRRRRRRGALGRVAHTPPCAHAEGTGTAVDRAGHPGDA
jgi:hypothetical protein